MHARWTASILKKMSRSLKAQRCCLSIRWSALIAERACRSAQFRPSLPSMIYRKSGKPTRRKMPSILAADGPRTWFQCAAGMAAHFYSEFFTTEVTGEHRAAFERYFAEWLLFI